MGIDIPSTDGRVYSGYVIVCFWKEAMASQRRDFIPPPLSNVAPPGIPMMGGAFPIIKDKVFMKLLKRLKEKQERKRLDDLRRAEEQFESVQGN